MHALPWHTFGSTLISSRQFINHLNDSSSLRLLSESANYLTLEHPLYGSAVCKLKSRQLPRRQFEKTLLFARIGKNAAPGAALVGLAVFKV
jgi:hypothetical protein